MDACKKIFGLALLAFCMVTSPAFAEVPVKKNADGKYIVNYLTAQFGSPQHSGMTTLAQVYNKLPDINLYFEVVATPGGNYILNYVNENREKMLKGEEPQYLHMGLSSSFDLLVRGIAPYQEFPQPYRRAVIGDAANVIFFVTFDPNIKTVRDLKGKKVGVERKVLPSMNDLPNKPYFEALGMEYKDINWQYLGADPSKTALLDNGVDAIMVNGNFEYQQDEKGDYIGTAFNPNALMLELFESGRPIYIVQDDREAIEKAYSTTNFFLLPIHIGEGVIKGQPALDARFQLNLMAADLSMPYEMVRDVIKARHEGRLEVRKVNNSIRHPDSQFPIGIPLELVHPHVYRAFEELGLPLPTGVTAPSPEEIEKALNYQAN